MATLNIAALGNTQAMGWADALLSRLAANSVSLAASLTLASGTKTADAPVISGTQTWNNAAVAFNGLLFNVTDTASAAASLLIDLQIGSSSKFKVTKAGELFIGTAGVSFSPASTTTLDIKASGSTATMGRWSTSQLVAVGGFSCAVAGGSAGSPDTFWIRDAANIWAQRNSTTAQSMRIYGTYTDASNYRRVDIGVTTAGVASIAPSGAGTGATGNILYISGLPTSNPGPGILWNSSGSVVVGT